MTELTKAERERIACMYGDVYVHRLLADLDAAAAAAAGARRRRTGSGRSASAVVRTCEDRDDMMAQRDRAESELDAERRMRVEAEAAAKRAESERDALKAKLADPRRVLIHETEVVATKEEIATLKTRLADLSEADEELHTCRAIVNATSENLSVDLERMVDDLAEANEKAARSEKDSHSWHELYKDTKAKLAALANAAEVVAENYEECAGFGELDCLAPLYAAIAAARGGATQ